MIIYGPYGLWENEDVFFFLLSCWGEDCMTCHNMYSVAVRRWILAFNDVAGGRKSLDICNCIVWFILIVFLYSNSACQGIHYPVDWFSWPWYMRGLANCRALPQNYAINIDLFRMQIKKLTLDRLSAWLGLFRLCDKNEKNRLSKAVGRISGRLRVIFTDPKRQPIRRVIDNDYMLITANLPAELPWASSL